MIDLVEFNGGQSDEFHPERALVTWLSRLSVDVTSPFSPIGPRKSFFTFEKTRLKYWDDAAKKWVLDPGETDPSSSRYIPHGQIVYMPNGGQDVPYVYFDSRVFGRLETASTLLSWSPPSGTAGSAVPYAQDLNTDKKLNSTEWTSDGNTNGVWDNGETITDSNNNKLLDLVGDVWANADTFQIISAGQDGKFGENRVRLYPTGAGYGPENTDFDNVTNFSDQSSLEASLP